MTAPDKPEMVVGLLGVAAICGFTIYRLFQWVRDLPVSADPWGAEIQKDLQEGNAVPVCHKCFTPQPPGQWFCEHCGSAVGDYNNLMPYVYLFSVGEVFRNGVADRLRVNALTVVGYLLISYNYLVLAPIYWFFFIRNLKRIKRENSHQV